MQSYYFYGITILVAILLIFSITILVVMYVVTSNMSSSFKNAWSYPGECANNNPKCVMVANDALGTVVVSGVDLKKYQKKNSIILMDLLERLTIAAENKTSFISIPPVRTELLATYFTVPYFIAIWRQITEDGKICLIFTFRGTTTSQEITLDQKVAQNEFLNTGTLVHSGFNYYYNQFRTTLLESLKQYPYDYCFITGHSLGAAIATLFSVDIVFNKQISKENLIVNVFGSPAVGNVDFSDLSLSLGYSFWRINNNADLIPNLPLTVMPNFTNPSGPLYYYKQAGTEISFYKTWGSIKHNHLLPIYKFSIEFLE